MRISKLMVAALLLGLPVSGWSQQAAPSGATEPDLQQPTAAIDAHFLQYQQTAHVPGMVWGIVRDGELIHLGASGIQDIESRRPVDADSLFRIASMSKAFTALAILKLRDEGRLSLDDPAELHVPELRGWTYPSVDSRRITIRDLLNHVAGFVTDNPWGDRQQPLSEEDFTQMLQRGVPLTRAPGLAFEYSNFGYALLGRIVTNVSGRPYDRYIAEEIMRPIGMVSTGYEVENVPQEGRALGYRWENEAHVREPDMRHGVFGAMGGVQTNARDYARWVAFLLSAWPARDDAETGPVRRSTVRELASSAGFPEHEERPGLPGSPSCQYISGYSLGMQVIKDCDLGAILAHSGGYPGYGSYLVLIPEQGLGLFAFANRTYAAPIAPIVSAALEYQRADWRAPPRLPVSPALASAYAAVGEIYAAGRLSPGQELLAMNFVLDQSAEDWARQLERLQGQTGTCRTDAPIVPTGALSGGFQWTCERQDLLGTLLLAPTDPPTIQALDLAIAQ